MERKLAEILEGAVAIPYDDELLKLLVFICRSYNEEDLFAKIDKCSLSFITGIISEDFSDYIASVLKEKESELTNLPANVLARLSLFSVYLTVIEEKDDLNRHLYATMFMNAMILAEGRWDELSNETVIQEIYKNHITKYLAKHDSEGVKFTTPIIGIIAGDPNGGNREYNHNDLQIIAKEAALYRCEKMLKSEGLLNIIDPFERVYRTITELVDSFQYLFYNYDVVTYVSQSVENEKSKTKKLSNVLKEIPPLSRANSSATSVLLRLLNREDVKGTDSLLRRRLSVMEFGIYLYFELLIERIIEQIEE